MNRNCVQCGKSFTLSQSEMDFYEKKNLNFPKRCKSCRDKNKSNTHYKKYTAYASIKNKDVYCGAIIAVLIFINAIAISSITLPIIILDIIGVITFAFLCVKKESIEIQEFDVSCYPHTFYNMESMTEHYIKHGKETNCRDMEEYLFKANYVIGNKSVISKTQKKDGDTAYFNTATNEFVVVAKAGYIRTYFIASLTYYNKQ